MRRHVGRCLQKGPTALLLAFLLAKMAAKTGNNPSMNKVIMHPLVLLSATDHYMRVAKDTSKRVVGVLLGAKEIAGERDSWRIATHEGQVKFQKFCA